VRAAASSACCTLGAARSSIIRTSTTSCRALSEDGTQWLPSRADFFLPVKALSILFRAKFRDAMNRGGLLVEVDPAVWRQDWVVHCQAVGDGRASLKYLAPYVFRVAISDRRIVSCEDGRVTFSYRRSGSNRWRKMTVDAHEFIRRLLQHVLPNGFQKVRHYGFLSPNCQESIEAVRWLVTLYYGLVNWLRGRIPQEIPSKPRIRCAACGGPMRVLTILPRTPCGYFDTSLAMIAPPHSPGDRPLASRGRSSLRVRAHFTSRVPRRSPRPRSSLDSVPIQQLFTHPQRLAAVAARWDSHR
jgi:hypothetical protein